MRLYSDKFFSIFSVVPPKKEQDRIVEHIKTQSEKINRFITAKKRFIELLKEQRQGIIDHAVTKGIDVDAKMKESVVGSIPIKWEVRRLKITDGIYILQVNGENKYTFKVIKN